MVRRLLSQAAMLRILLILVLGACGSDTARDIPDMFSTADLTASVDLEYPCGRLGDNSCSVPADVNHLCYDFEAVCACLDGQWNCCNPSIYTCQPQPHTGDYCCPTGFNEEGDRPEQCGCRCVGYKYVCDLDLGTRD